MLSVLGLKVVAKPSREALIHGAIAGCTRFRLGHGDEQRIGSIDGQDIARAGTRVMHIADTVTATDHNLRSRCIGKAKPRTKVGKIRIHQRLAIDPAGRDRSHRAGLLHNPV